MTNIGTEFAMDKQDIDIKEIRELAKKFTPEEIESCIKQQLQEGINICEVTGPAEHVIGELAKAQFVKGLTEKGMSITDAVRELARRIRLVQKGFKEE
jgi:hypothetical protein